MDILEPKLEVQYYKANYKAGGKGYQPNKPLDISKPPIGQHQVHNIQPIGYSGGSGITFNDLILDVNIYPGDAGVGLGSPPPSEKLDISSGVTFDTLILNNNSATSEGHRLFTQEQIEELHKQLDVSKGNIKPKEYPLPDIIIPGVL